MACAPWAVNSPGSTDQVGQGSAEYFDNSVLVLVGERTPWRTNRTTFSKTKSGAASAETVEGNPNAKGRQRTAAAKDKINFMDSLPIAKDDKAHQVVELQCIA
jgi:hypothetical protein